jgi:hypothetical protein
VGDHRVLRKSASLQYFLELDDEKFKELANQKLPAKIKSSYGSFFRKSISTEEKMITIARLFTNNLEEIIKSLKLKLTNVIKTRKESSKTIEEFGDSFKSLSDLEKDNHKFKKTLELIRERTNSLAKAGYVQSDKESIHLIEGLIYYESKCASVRISIQNLTDLRSVKDDQIFATQSVNDKLNSTQKFPIGKEVLIEKLKKDLEDEKKKETDLINSLNIQVENFKSDFIMFSKQREVDFRIILESFVKLQTEYHMTSIKEWSNIIPSIENIFDEK